jgi:2-C-methyl-D-erythritol 4-phosphate cytidylyltransferase
MNTAIIVAAGRGTRMGGAVCKQYLPLNGAPILARTLSVFIRSGLFQEAILVVAASEMANCRHRVLEGLPGGQSVRLVAGGRERQESVYNGIEACRGQDDDIVLIHDGVRPFVSHDILSRCLEGVQKNGACIAAVPTSDTLKVVNADGRISETMPRANIWQAQTPQGFRLGLIREAHRLARYEGFIGTDDAQLVEHMGHVVTVVPGLGMNIKVTTPEDLALAEVMWRHLRQHAADG